MEECEEEARVKARETRAVPSVKEVEEHNLDHRVFRGWCPHCVKGRAESYGHSGVSEKEKSVPVIALDYMYMHSQQSRTTRRRRVCRL
jgi:hypothetical protein